MSRTTGARRSSSSPTRGRDAALTGRRIFAEIEAEWAEELGEELVAGLREAAERIAELEDAPYRRRRACER